MILTRWMKSAIAACAVAVLMIAAAPAVSADPAPEPAPSPTALCDAISPIAIPCVGLGKFGDAAAAECRRVGIPDTLCLLPLSHRVTQAARDAYQQSWVHRTAQFQYALGDSLPFTDAQWLGTHNSFNSLSSSFTLSHADSNQQLSLTQQLDIDIRALELDLHYIPRLELLGGKAVTVCHGQGAEALHLGCTNEPTFTRVLPEIATWLNRSANSNEVVLLYLEDALKDAKAYASAVATLETVLRRPNGSSLIYRPDPAQKAGNGCVPMPTGISRDDIRASGARVILVGSCAPGWSGAVFDWNPTHVESGNTAAYQEFPACDSTHGASAYATKMVRYYEDSTLVSTLLDPQRAPVNPNALTPAKVRAMTECGVNLFGFDQILPEDGRIQGSLWSWAPGEPAGGAGACAFQGADGRWATTPCTTLLPAACQKAGVWTVTHPVPFAAAAGACTSIGSTFAVPRAGHQNSRLHAVAGTAGAWVKHQVS